MSEGSGEQSWCPSYEDLATYAQAGSSDPAMHGHVQACPACLHEVKLMREDAGAVSRVAEYLRDTCTSPGAMTGSAMIGVTGPVDGYVLDGEIARGAQGIVYRAVQERTNRVVAIKVLREGLLGSSKARARFEREVEIVAGLNHPNIVTVHHAVLVGGSQALVMEYVDGVPLTQWASARGRAPSDEGAEKEAKSSAGDRSTAGASGRDDLRARLALFVKVCDAVAHAHQQGVIHRDLKPSNILVDAAGEPLLLDFGIAKPLADAGAAPHGHAAATAAWENTHTGEFAGTLAYASPEQVAGDPRRIGTGSDVYSLGVVLFEFLTGQMPYPIEGTMLDVARRIENVPSRRASSVCQHADSELDAILLTALQKEPARRYVSALAMKEEIERYLTGLPLLAKRTHTGYVLRKWMWRHKAAVIGSCTFLGTLIAATIVAIAFAVQARDAREETRGALGREKERSDQLQERSELLKQRSNLLQRQAYEGHIFAAQEALAAMDASGVVESLKLAEKAPPALRGWEWNFLNAQVEQSDKSFLWEWGSFMDGGISDDGHWAATYSYLGRINIWDMDAPSSRPLPLPLAAFESIIYEYVAISPDGRLIATSDPQHVVRILGREIGEFFHTGFPHDSAVLDIAFAPDGKRLITACADGSRRIWNIERAQVEHLFNEPTQRSFIGGNRKLQAQAIAITRDGSNLVTSFSDGRIVMRNVDSEQLVWSQRADNRSEQDLGLGATRFDVRSVAVSDDNTIVASGHRDGTVRLWNGQTGEPIGLLSGHRGRGVVVAFVPESHDLLAGSGDGLVRLWNTDNKSIKRTYFGLVDQVTSISCTRSHPLAFLATSESHTSRMWMLDSPESVRILAHDGNAVYGIAFSGWDNTIWTAADDASLRCWNTKSGVLGRREKLLDLPDNPLVKSVERGIMSLRGIAACSWNNDDLLATTQALGAVNLWRDGHGVSTLRTPGALRALEATSPAFSVDGKRLIVSFEKEAVVWWNLDQPRSPKVIRRSGPYCHAATISPDGTQIVVLTTDGILTFYDADTGKMLPGKCHLPEIYSGREPTIMSFNNDGTRLAAPVNHEIVIVDVQARKQVQTCYGHTGVVNSARFSPDGTRIVSASMDTTVRLWETSTGDRRLVLRKHEQGVYDAVFSPDGRVIVSCGKDGNALVWDSATKK